MTKLLPTFVLLAALVATPGFAEPSPATNHVVVRTADLDLATVPGQRLLDRRLATAVDDACGAASKNDLAGSNEVRRCRIKTRAQIASDRERLIALASRSTFFVIAAR